MYISSTSATFLVAALERLKIWSKPAVIRLPVVMMNRTEMVGRMFGSVTCQIRCQRVAPSISAASYWSWSMPDIAESLELDADNAMELRKDSLEECGISRDEILKNAPKVVAGCVVVPKTVD